MARRYADCLVIGGGIIGLLTARILLTAGLKVTVLERGEVVRESSWAGGGILSPLYPWRCTPAINALARLSQLEYPALAEELREKTGIDPEYLSSGLLVLTNEDQEEIEAWADYEEMICCPFQDHEAALPIAPEIEWPDEEAGIWLPEVGQIRNPLLGQALYAMVANNCGEIHTHTEVSGFIREGNRVTGVTTNRGEYYADYTVITAGAWSGDLLGGILPTLPVYPVRGQMVLYKADPDLLRAIVLANDRYLIPRKDGRILVGSTVEEAGFNKHITSDALRSLNEHAVKWLPALAEYPIERHWAGLRPGSPNGTPIISSHPTLDHLYLNTGHFRNGVVLGPASAQLVANLILGHTPIVNPEPYQLRLI